MQIKKIRLSSLEQLQMPALIKGVITAIKNNDVKKLNLEFLLKILEEHQLKVGTLDVPMGSHPMTKQTDFWHKQRVDLASSILGQAKSIAQANLTSTKEEVEIVLRVVNMHLKKLRKNNRSEIESLIDIFVKHINKNLMVKNAFDKIGLMSYVDELQLANETYIRLDLKRQSSMVKTQKRDVNKKITKEAQAALRSFFEFVEVANRTYPELDYKPLMMELNTLIAEFTNLIKTRATYKKKKKKKTAAASSSKMQVMCVDKKPTGVLVIKKKEKPK